MSLTLTGPLIQEKLRLHSGYTWHELWEVRIDDSYVAYITGHPTSVTFGGQVYSPYPISRAEIIRDNEGGISEVTVALSNVLREPQDLIRTGGLMGRTAILRLVNSNALGAVANVITERFKILYADMTLLDCVLHLGQINLLEHPFPAGRFLRTTCRWVYGSTECGYDTTRSGAIATCDKTLSGGNGCIVHGTDEVTAGKPRLHPLRFGGFKNLLKGPYAV